MWFIANENVGGAGMPEKTAARAAPASWKTGFSSFSEDAKYDTGPRSTMTFAAPVGLPMTLVSTPMWCAPRSRDGRVRGVSEPVNLGRDVVGAPWRFGDRPR